jgi:hypothetical protein
MAAGKPEAAGNMEVPVPLEALAMPGEDDKLENPAVGDPVQLMAEGTVTRIEGDTAFVSVKSVNGKPLSAEAAQTTNTPDADGDNEFAQLRSEAEQQPEGM